uniref:Quinone oxidoreductase-like n=1 Tax=Phallusia mammillata TaxID=59560 RepID=A0A6F9DAL4_9ASCI|nr:quinone oxidoreductase-like [Phallusia mammillata]
MMLQADICYCFTFILIILECTSYVLTTKGTTFFPDRNNRIDQEFCSANMLSSKGGKVLSSTAMRAVVVSKFGDESVLEVQRNVPIPTVESGEVMVKVAAIGVNPVETYIRSGNYKMLPKLPYVPGNDISGTIVAIGANVTMFKEGDRVASFMRVKSGAYAEYCAVHSDWLMPLPNDFDFRKGAAIGTPYFTAYKALFLKANAKANDVLLVHGASGGVGMAACQLAVSHGMKVFGTAGSKEGMDVVLQQGAERAFNHKEKGYTDKILEATNGHGPDIIIEMLSNVNLNRDLEIVAPKGRIVIVGCRGTIEMNPRLIMGKESRVEGVALAVTTKEEFSEMNRAISARVKTGSINPCIGKEFSLNDVQRAHREIISNSGSKGKMVLIV